MIPPPIYFRSPSEWRLMTNQWRQMTRKLTDDWTRKGIQILWEKTIMASIEKRIFSTEHSSVGECILYVDYDKNQRVILNIPPLLRQNCWKVCEITSIRLQTWYLLPLHLLYYPIYCMLLLLCFFHIQILSSKIWTAVITPICLVKSCMNGIILVNCTCLAILSVQ